MRISDEMVEAFSVAERKYEDEDAGRTEEPGWDWNTMIEEAQRAGLAAALVAGGFKEEIVTFDNFGHAHESRIVGPLGPWEQKT